MMRMMSMAAALVLLGTVANAGAPLPPAPSAPGSDRDTRAFVGLNWTFGGGRASPEGVLGIARVKTQHDGDSHGAKLSLHMPFTNGLTFGKVKLVGVTGKNDGMVEGGIGFGTNGVFGTAGLWAPYVDAGVDLGFGGVEGYAGLNSLDKWDRP